VGPGKIPLEIWPKIESATQWAVDEGLSDLMGALRIASVSAEGRGLRESAEYLSGVLQRDGWSAEIVELDGNPIVLAEIGPNAGPSLILYGHHDVQPSDPDAAWESPPFEPTVRSGRIFGRGSADNKGQFFCHIFAARAIRRALGDIPVRLKLVLDGQEEVGSVQMPAFIKRMQSRLEGALMCVTADGPTRLEGRPEVVFGVRGSLKFRMSVRTAATDLHSGNWGNLAPSAAWRLARILAELKGADGRVTVPGFYDHIVPPSAADRQALAELPFDAAEAQRSISAIFLDGPSNVPALERIMFLPTFTVIGIQGGYTGRGFKTVIPCEAFANVDVRLVADQDPDWMYQLLKDHLRRRAPDVQLEHLGYYRPNRTPLDTAEATLVVDAVTTGFGQRPLKIPCAGGSLPDAAFANGLGIPVLDVPYGAPDQRNHAPNENMRLDLIHKGTRTSAALVLLLAGANKAASNGRPAD
jgi:acetylornithine deacetylase/succinyl-diaminopimelate desuccinylase-like protein